MANFTGLTVEELVGALKQTPPHTLQAVELFKQHAPAPGRLFPSGLTKAQYIDATREMISYQRKCGAMVQQIIKMTHPIPARTPHSDRFCL